MDLDEYKRYSSLRGLNRLRACTDPVPPPGRGRQSSMTGLGIFPKLPFNVTLSEAKSPGTVGTMVNECGVRYTGWERISGPTRVSRRARPVIL